MGISNYPNLDCAYCGETNGNVYCVVDTFTCDYCKKENEIVKNFHARRKAEGQKE